MDGGLLNNLSIIVLILIALGAAWFLGYRSKFKKAGLGNHKLTGEYFVGLNYLLNDEPDGAIDVFIKALEDNPRTLETNIALGTLLRRRGKVDRSITVFQDVLARPELGADDLDRVKIELVRSYITAGLLDRADGLLEELQSSSTEIRVLALIQAITVYQIAKDWKKAIKACKKLLEICPANQRSSYQNQASHFYCELATSEISVQHFTSAHELLKKSAKMDKSNVRTSLILGGLEFRHEHYKEAIKALEKVVKQDALFLSEAFPLLLRSYQREGQDKKLQQFIKNSLDLQSSATVLLSIADYIEEQSGKKQANLFLLEQLKLRPSLRLLTRSLLLSGNENDSVESFLFFHNILSEYMNNRALYQCGNCGFELKALLWLCPSCAVWGEVKPIHVMPVD